MPSIPGVGAPVEKPMSMVPSIGLKPPFPMSMPPLPSMPSLASTAQNPLKKAGA